MNGAIRECKCRICGYEAESGFFGKDLTVCMDCEDKVSVEESRAGEGGSGE